MKLNGKFRIVQYNTVQNKGDDKKQFFLKNGIFLDKTVTSYKVELLYIVSGGPVKMRFYRISSVQFHGKISVQTLCALKIKSN